MARLPFQATSGSGACDLCSVEHRTIPPYQAISSKGGKIIAIDTGLSLEIPAGWVGLVCPRSGLALNSGLSIVNAPGIIDSDYRGLIKVIVINFGSRFIAIKPGDKIAQLLVIPHNAYHFHLVSDLSESERGEKGFGSTGNS